MDQTLRLELEAPADVPLGASVALRLRLRNAGAKPVTVYLRGRETLFDFVVTRAGGARSDTVWRRLSGDPAQAIIRLQRLGPGEGIVLADRWDQRDRAGNPVPPGEYVLRGVLFTDRSEPMESDPRVLRIVPPGRGRG